MAIICLHPINHNGSFQKYDIPNLTKEVLNLLSDRRE